MLSNKEEGRREILLSKRYYWKFLIRLQLIKTSYNNSIERVKYLEHEISDTDDSIAIKKTKVKKLSNKLRKYTNTSSRDLLLKKGRNIPNNTIKYSL